MGLATNQTPVHHTTQQTCALHQCIFCPLDRHQTLDAFFEPLSGCAAIRPPTQRGIGKLHVDEYVRRTTHVRFPVEHRHAFAIPQTTRHVENDHRAVQVVALL